MTEKKIPQRQDIAKEHKWDLSSMFQSENDWESLYSGLESEIEKYPMYKGKMGESLSRFKEVLDFNLNISRKIEKLYTYAHLKSDEDKTNQSYQALYQRAVNLYTRISEASSYMTPEIQSIPDETMKFYLKNEIMKDYVFYIEKTIRYKPHTLSEEIEQILAMSGEVVQASSEIFSQLDNADMKFASIVDDQGNMVELSHGNFNSFLMNPSQEVRKNAFFQFYQSYKDHENTLGATLGYSNKNDLFFSRVRKFISSREAALFSDNVSANVYDNLIKTVKNNLEPLLNYLSFRKEALGLSELHFYDTYVPLVQDVDFNMPYEEAVDICIQALEPLGQDYLGILRDGLLGGWVDRYENKGKRSGAYSSGCFDSAPYILLNYKDDNINSLYTLIHEAGHSMHSYYSKKYQPYVLHDYTIFVAEVASTFNETLLSKYLLNLYKNDPKMQAYILNREIDNIRGTLFRQTMFAEFEKESHQIIEELKPLTLEVITELYNRLLKSYFGNTMVIDDVLKLECLRIPHFYSAFYVYKYATGISAAIALADKVIKEGDKTRDSYLDFLKLGGSKFPIDELLDAGVNMQSPEPIEKAIQHFKELVDEFTTVYQTI